MPSTPVMLLVGCVFLLAWKTGALGNLVAKFRGSQTPPPPRQIRSAAEAGSSLAFVGPTSAEDLASRYPSEALGLAFHLAVRREADAETARRFADETRAAAVTAYQAPFGAGGGSAPPPPVPPRP